MQIWWFRNCASVQLPYLSSGNVFASDQHHQTKKLHQKKRFCTNKSTQTRPCRDKKSPRDKTKTANRLILEVQLLAAGAWKESRLVSKGGNSDVAVKKQHWQSKLPLHGSSCLSQTTVDLLFLARRRSCSSVLWICGCLHQTSAVFTHRRAMFAEYNCCVKLDYTANQGRRSGLCDEILTSMRCC